MSHDLVSDSREAILLAELQHRVRNTLATTRMIARRTAETSENLEDYVAHLDGRLAALARVQNAAIRDPLAGIDLELLVADEVTGAGLARHRSLTVGGSRLLLHPRAAETFALAVHELLTNAIKFGALSRPGGRLAISWHVEDGAPRLMRFDWVETGVNVPETIQRRKGFGTLVLQELLRHNLGAETRMDLAPTGLTCRIVLPLTDRMLPSGNLV